MPGSSASAGGSGGSLPANGRSEGGPCPEPVCGGSGRTDPGKCAQEREPVGEPSGEYLGGGGAEGIRTPDLLIANETLYQLSYDPVPKWAKRCRFGGGVARTGFDGTFFGFGRVLGASPSGRSHGWAAMACRDRGPLFSPENRRRSRRCGASGRTTRPRARGRTGESSGRVAEPGAGRSWESPGATRRWWRGRRVRRRGSDDSCEEYGGVDQTLAV